MVVFPYRLFYFARGVIFRLANCIVIEKCLVKSIEPILHLLEFLLATIELILNIHFLASFFSLFFPDIC